MDKNLMMTVCLCLGALCWVIAAGFAVYHRKNVKSAVRFAGVGVFVSLFFLFYPYTSAVNKPFAVPLSIFQVISSATVGSDPIAVVSVLTEGYDVPFIGVYQAIIIVLHVIAPLFTLGITLSFFANKFSAISYRIRSGSRDSHIFSDVNERTLCLAESIHAADKKSLLVFIGDTEKLEERREVFERIRKIGGCILNVMPTEIRHSLKRTRTYYLLSPSEEDNLKEAISLFDKYDKIGGDRIKIWLYSNDDTASVIFDNLDERIDIRLVNEEYLVALELMRSYPLYRGIKNGRLVILILGAGNIGMEILRMSMWCSCLGENVETEFHVLDIDAEKTARRFEKLCPGMAEKYSVKFYSADVETSEFGDVLGKVEPTYIVATLGDEGRNIAACIEMRRMYGFDGEFPLIHVLVDRDDTKETILDRLQISDWSFSSEIDAYRKTEICKFSLMPFGSYTGTYSSVRFSKGYYDSLSMAINAVHCNITETSDAHDCEYFRDLLNKVEFYKNYAYAYATAIPYKLWLMGLELKGDGRGDVSLLEKEIPRFETELVLQEENRWMCYMESIGWKPMTLDKVCGRVFQDKLRREHARLIPENIPELSTITGRDFNEENIRDVRRLPTVIRLANSLSDIPYSVVRISDK